MRKHLGVKKRRDWRREYLWIKNTWRQRLADVREELADIVATLKAR